MDDPATWSVGDSCTYGVFDLPDVHCSGAYHEEDAAQTSGLGQNKYEECYYLAYFTGKQASLDSQNEQTFVEMFMSQLDSANDPESLKQLIELLRRMD